MIDRNKLINNNKKIRVLLLFSGGLDSILAAKILKKQKVDIIGICFYTPFFNYDLAEKSAKKINLELKNISDKLC